MARCEMIDMTGHETETYKVLYRDRDRANTTKAYWVCSCKLCGSEFSVLGKYLRRGDQKSCGCRVGRKKQKKIVGKEED